MSETSKKLNWKWGICSFENKPSLHATKIMQKIAERSFGFRSNQEDRMSQNQFDVSLLKMHDNFYFVNVNETDVSMEGLLEKGMELVKRKGINGLLIDPWNYVEQNKPSGMTETEYISLCLTQLAAFCKKTDVHAFLVAHPTKLKKENGKFEVPNMYSISGSAHFFNKTDNGISVYRDFETNIITVYVQKVRDEWNGKQGMCQFRYDKERRQYISQKEF
jgi:twinkle protein